MSYRKIPPEKILKFKATSGFKGWKHLFSKDSVTHPAKMNLDLLRFILSKYTKPSDTVLDPMAGTGSTIVLASIMGRDGIAVEFEPKFCDMIQDNISRTEKQTTFTAKGSMKCYNGDARELSKLLIESDAIITSPPYGNRLSDVAIQDGDPARMGYRQTVDVVLTSPPYGSDNANLQAREDKSATSILASTGVRGVELDPKNLGNLEYGNIDAVITSPPYSECIQFLDEEFSKKARPGRSYHTGILPSDNNIGNLKSDNYLEAMLQVYHEAYKVLKAEGTMVLVTKNFIRNKKVVRLDLDTIKLCEKAGFTLVNHWYFKLPQKSFWKILYHRKFPDVPEVECEDVIVFKKITVPPKWR